MLHQPYTEHLPVLLQPNRHLQGLPSFPQSAYSYALPILSLTFLFPALLNSCFKYFPKFPIAVHSYRCSNRRSFLLSNILVTHYFRKICACYFSVLPSYSKRRCIISRKQAFFILFLSHCEPVILKVFFSFRRILILYGTVDMRQSRDILDSVAFRIQT